MLTGTVELFDVKVHLSVIKVAADELLKVMPLPVSVNVQDVALMVPVFTNPLGLPESVKVADAATTVPELFKLALSPSFIAAPDKRLSVPALFIFPWGLPLPSSNTAPGFKVTVAPNAIA